MVEEQQTGDEKVEAKLTDNNTVTITDAGALQKKGGNRDTARVR